MDNNIEESKPEIEKTKPPNFDPIEIPDLSVYKSDFALRDTDIIILYSELQSYFNWIKEQAQLHKGISLIDKATNLTIKSLKANVDEWKRIVYQGKSLEYTLGKTIEEGVNLCTHRAIFFNLLMQQVGVPATVVNGTCFEAERSNLYEYSENTYMGMIDGEGKLLFIAGPESEGKHAWNMINFEGKNYLVDTAYLLSTEKGWNPVIQPVETNILQRHFCFPLSNGLNRHYIKENHPVIVPLIQEKKR